MKILTVCAGGNCRSVTLATLLKYNFHGDPKAGGGLSGTWHDALPCSVEKNADSTLAMLFDWADVIHPVDDEIAEAVREKMTMVLGFRYESKPVRIIPIGRDHWGLSMHPGLVMIAYPLLVAAGYAPTKTLEAILARGSKYSLRRGEADPLEGV